MVRRRIINILLKEWEYYITDTNNIMLMTFLPLLITGQLVLYIWLAVSFAGESALTMSVFQNALENLVQATPAVAALSGEEQFRVLLLSQFSFYMLLIPIMS